MRALLAVTFLKIDFPEHGWSASICVVLEGFSPPFFLLGGQVERKSQGKPLAIQGCLLGRALRAPVGT